MRTIKVILAILFVVFAPIFLLKAVKNLDSTYWLLYGALFIVLSLLFFRFARFRTRKGWVIALCCMGVVFFHSMRRMKTMPSIKTASAIIARFPNIETWNIGAAETASDLFTGEYIFYDEDREYLEVKNVNPDDISVIVFYSKEENDAGTYYYEGTGKKAGNATTETIHVTLVNAATKSVIARESFSSGAPQQTIRQGEGSNMHTGIHHYDPRILEFIDSYFQ